jgi:hypothetical protein
MNTPWPESVWMLPATITLGAASVIGIRSLWLRRRRQEQEISDLNLVGRALRHHGLTPGEVAASGRESELMQALRSDLSVSIGTRCGNGAPHRGGLP